jgi:hypothetical protein
MIIVSATLEKDEPLLDEFFDPKFDRVTLRKGEMELVPSESSGHYYYFQNLKPGQYEIGELVHFLLKGNGGNFQGHASNKKSIQPTFSPEERLKTLVDLEPGSVVFLGEIQVRAQIRYTEPTIVESKFTKSVSAERRAMEYLMRNFPRSGWAELAKSRLSTLQSIQISE